MRRTCAALAVTLLWAWSTIAVAADLASTSAAPSQPDTQPLYETIVTAEREAPPGASASAVTREMLADLPGGETQPGFVADTFGFGLHVRGADGGLLYVIDGIPLMAAPLGQWGGTQGFIPTRLVQSLSIVTGGFPAEFGSGLGAVIDITTRHAVGGPSGEAQIAYGTYGTTNASFNYAQEIGKLSLFVGGNFETTDRGFDPPSVSPIVHDKMTTGAGFTRLDYLVNDHDRVEFIASFDQSRFQIPIDPTLLPLSQAPANAVRGPDAYGNVPPPFVPYDANPVESERNVFAALSYRHAGAASTVQIAPFVRETYGNLACDPAGSLGATADPGSTCSDVRRDVLHGGALANLTWLPGSGQTLKAGLLADFARSNVDYTAYFRDDASALGGPDPTQTQFGSDKSNVLLGGVYLQDEIKRGAWTVLPGARLDLENASFVQSNEPSLFLLGPSARLGVTYAATKKVTLHGFAGYLWQPPSTLDAPAAGRYLLPEYAGQSLAVDIKAEKDWSGELGISGQVLPRLTLGLTGWGRLATDQLDRVNVGTTNLVASYNFEKGRAAGIEAWCTAGVGEILTGFANLGLQMAQGQGISSEKFLFTPDEIADKSWVMLDHVQTWTANLGFDLHDAKQDNHLSGLVNYGSGLRTGPDSNETVPSHITLDLSLRHRLAPVMRTRPEVAFDVLNVFDEIYAYRIGTGYVGSAYGPLRRVILRLAIPFS